jgi:hypothetical protein
LFTIEYVNMVSDPEKMVQGGNRNERQTIDSVLFDKRFVFDFAWLDSAPCGGLASGHCGMVPYLCFEK